MLSADAAPVIFEYEPQDDWVDAAVVFPFMTSSTPVSLVAVKEDPDWVSEYKGNIGSVREDSYRQWNLSRFTAKTLLGDEKTGSGSRTTARMRKEINTKE